MINKINELINDKEFLTLPLDFKYSLINKIINFNISVIDELKQNTEESNNVYRGYVEFQSNISNTLNSITSNILINKNDDVLIDSSVKESFAKSFQKIISESVNLDTEHNTRIAAVKINDNKVMGLIKLQFVLNKKFDDYLNSSKNQVKKPSLI